MKAWFLVTAACIFFSLRTVAGISGKVTGMDNEAVATASIILLQANDNSLVKSVLTDDAGIFNIDVQNGVYVLKVIAAGYQQYHSDTIRLEGEMEVPVIRLNAMSNQMKEMTVRGQKPLVEIYADKLVVNVENSSVNAGASALDVLSRSPGVNVDQNDNISIKGRQGVNVMIDGKNMVLSGADLANILRAMPSNTISKIEIISNPGARYDAAGTAGIINIVTRRDKRMGVSGSINASIGQGVYPKYSAGGMLNYRSKKLSGYVSYNYARRWWFNHLKLNRRFYQPNSDVLMFSYIQDNFMKMPLDNHTGTLGLDYNVSDKTIIGVVFTGGSTGFDQHARNNSCALDGADNLIYHFNTKGDHRQDYNNYSGNFNIRHRFNEAGQNLNIDLDYARYASQSNQNFVTDYTNADGTPYQPTYYMRSDMNGTTQINAVKADYSLPFSEKAKLETGVKATYVISDNEPLFFEKTTGDFVLDTKRSNHFIYRENINAGYINFNREWEKWGLQAGLRLENTNVEADQVTLDSLYTTSYTQLFPSMAVQRKLNEQHNLGLTISRRIQRPNYQQLNPFKFFIDNTTYRAGYPYLRPALTYSTELSHTYKKRFNTSLGYSITTDNITQVIQPSETEDSVTVQTDKNLARVNTYTLSANYPFQVTKWWSNMNNLTAWYAHFTGYLANTQLSNGSPGFSVYSNNNFMLPKGFGAEAIFWYQSRQVYGFFDLNPMWTLGLGVQKSLFNQKATIKLNATDIFWTGPPSATSTYDAYQEDFTVRRETRQVTLSFTYAFGNNNIKPTRKRATGAEDEKSRVGNAG